MRKYISLRETKNLLTGKKRYYADSKLISKEKYWDIFDARISYSSGALVFSKKYRRSYCVIENGGIHV